MLRWSKVEAEWCWLIDQYVLQLVLFSFVASLRQTFEEREK
jgi:hypothetical protein